MLPLKLPLCLFFLPAKRRCCLLSLHRYTADAKAATMLSKAKAMRVTGHQTGYTSSIDSAQRSTVAFKDSAGSPADRVKNPRAHTHVPVSALHVP